MANFLDALNTVIWSPVLVFLCLGAGIYFTVVTRGLQVRCIPDMLKQIVNGEKSADGVSSFQSLMVSLSGRVGVGNIAGVATAIAFGGPGAVFWMWAVAFWARPPRSSNVRWLRFTRKRIRTPVSTVAVPRITSRRSTSTLRRRLSWWSTALYLPSP